jgi:hypothetical protein
MAENRWSVRRLRAEALAQIDRAPHHPVARSRQAVTNLGSWSTGEALPVGVLVDRSTPYALGWQIEHNGPWHYELGETRRGGYLLLSGPTDEEHQWSVEVDAERSFTTVPVSLHTADPTSGNQTTSESAYTSYARVSPARTSGGYTCSAGVATNTAAVTFPACTGGSSTVTHACVGRDSTGTGEVLCAGALTASLSVSTGITPQFAISGLSITIA